jgi:NHL repeat
MSSPVAKTCRMSRRQRSTMITLLLAGALVLAFGGAQAQAAPKGVVGFVGQPGTGAGQFTNPRGIAVNESTGHLYVADSTVHRIQEFDALGNFVRTWGYGVTTGAAAFQICNAPGPCRSGLTGGGAGQVANPQSIAVDQDTGAVYVTSPANRRVDKFDSSGNFLFAFGWGVDTGAAALETCTTASTCQAGTTGAGAGQFGATGAGSVAVDPRNGDAVVADPGNRRVQKFDSSGAHLFAFGWGVDTGAAALETCTTASTCQAGTSGAGPGQFATSTPTSVAVDSAGSIFTVEPGQGFGTERRVEKFNAAATIGGPFAPDHTSVGFDAPAPNNVAIDSSNDHVLVAKGDEVLELDGGGGLADTHAAGSGLPEAAGLAVDGPGDRIYLTIVQNAQSGIDNNRVFILGVVTPPTATISPVTDVTATSATFHGTVNPNGSGLPTRYHFEYSDDGGATWTPVPVPDTDVGNGTADVPANQAATGLEPNTSYRVRLVASRPFAGGSATSGQQTFTTDAAPPAISAVGSSEITDTTAVLGGRIDPNHSQTTYHFEYGTDTSYGNSTTVDNAGAGPTNVAVSKALTGLQPSTEYHFRLLASNAAGDVASADHTFTTDATPPQPSGRAYEMVSPVDKNDGDIERDLPGGRLVYQTGAASSGDVVAFASRANFGDVESGATSTNTPNYLARRGNDGWTTEAIVPPVDEDYPQGLESPRVVGLALDASRSFAMSGASLTPEADRLNGSVGLYMRSAGEAADQRYTLISAPPGPLLADPNVNFAQARFEWEASTPDARHVVFNSGRQLLPEGRPDSPNANPNSVYEWVDGTLRLVSVPPPGVTFSSNPFVIAGSTGATARPLRLSLHGDNVISDDGGRVFFTAPVLGAGRPLFVRENGATTRVVSASERSADPGARRAGDFWSANSADGSVALFTSDSPLTEDAVIAAGGGPMLYRWDANAPDGHHLTAITTDDPLDAPGVLGPTAISDDATSVYFVAKGELAPGATRGQPNLYRWRLGQGTRYIAALDATGATNSVLTGAVDTPLWERQWFKNGGRGGRVSNDGERLLFASYARLDPDYDTTEDSPEDCGDPQVAGERCRQIYLYNASSDRISCLTCVAGTPVSGDANLFGNGDIRRGPAEPQSSAPLDLPRNLSADGRRAYFESSRPLLTADENHVTDVYEWDDSDLDGVGRLRLVSSGRSGTKSLFLDASPLGRDVFFTTRDRLVGLDNDSQVDLYDARVGGGIAAQNPTATSPPCEGEACQGELTGTPFLPSVGSGGASRGDSDPGPRPTFSVARLSRAQRAQLARGRRVPLRVHVNRPGKVRLAAHAKLGKRMRTVAADSKTARKAGSLMLSVKLSRAALHELARKGRLKLALAVRFAGVREARTSKVSLRRGRSAGERRPR